MGIRHTITNYQQKDINIQDILKSKIKEWTAGQEIKKVIFVKGRLVNVVV